MSNLKICRKEHIMKKTFVYFTLLSIAICILILTASCRENSSNNTTNSINISGYTIVYPQNADDTVKAASAKLSENLGNIPLCDDITLADTNNRSEILVGATNRTETHIYSETIKNLDFTIEHNDGRIIICGGSADSTADAVNYFIENFANEDKTQAKIKSYTYNHSYEVSSFKVGNTEVPCFNIITNCTNSAYDDIIADLKVKLTEKTGLSGTNHGHALNIMIKNDSSLASDKYLIRVSENDITFSGANIYTINAAIDYFFDFLIKNGNISLNNGDEFTGIIEKEESLYGNFINNRALLYNTLNRLKNDKELNIVYFGGSVTAGHGADNPDTDSWRAKIGTWFESNFADAQINNYNAAIGGSGSMLGAFRCEHDVLSLSPDLVFIEFAVNDVYCQSEIDDIKTYYEYIIRSIKEKNPNCDIVTLYITDQSGARNDENQMSQAALAQDEIAKHYNISSIALGSAICSLFDYNDQAKWQEYFSDIVNPNNAGYDVYYNVIKEFLEANLIYEAVGIEEMPEYTLPERLSDKDFKPQFITADNFQIISNTAWEYSDSSYWDTANPYSGYIYPTANENELSISFEGNNAALMAQYSIDNRLIYSFDENNERIQNQKGNQPLLLEASKNNDSDEHVLHLSVKLDDITTPYIITALLVW